ncbi:hypothetical protein [uncultured Thermomonospora sp.]|uniref:hypothetical protein n=1 Tax=uncultured Thermomonospora sp. TaxID=671175 RepID=UPI00259B9B0E|nr:hypothetical protein [uncultured Thermomonospora sp.]
MTRTRPHRRGAALAIIPLLILGLAGCGSGGAGASGTGRPAADDEERMLKFAQCMRENGVDMPDPEDGKVRITNRKSKDGSETNGKEEVDAAMKKCRQYMPNGGKPPKLSPEDQEKMRNYAECMREHGIDMEDPGPDGKINIRMKKGGKEDDLKKAEEACRNHMPARLQERAPN